MLAYFDCFAGISGDMLLGALVDLGVPLAWLKQRLDQLPLEGFHLNAETVHRGGLTACKVSVVCDGPAPARSFTDIRNLLDNAELPAQVQQSSLEAFGRIAEAEARVHRCEIEKVHFHEVGAVDALVDIVGSALCIEHLGISRIVSSPLPLGSGFVSCAHGTLPLPAPATLAILENVPVYGSGVFAELVTPTGAALVASLAESYGPLPAMALSRSGYGAGARDLQARPNVLRVICGDVRSAGTVDTDTVIVLESCVDDMNPEIYGHLMDRLFADGALDVWWVPVYMKKNRPGTLIQILCRRADEDRITARVFSETTTLGVRRHEAGRSILPRMAVKAATSFGLLPAKRVYGPDGAVTLVPEYESCRRIAVERDLPLKQVYQQLACELANDGVRKIRSDGNEDEKS